MKTKLKCTAMRSLQATATSSLVSVVLALSLTGGTRVAVAQPCDERQDILAPDAAEGGSFGHSVAISGDTAVVGAPVQDGPAGRASGAAFVFIRIGGTWMQQQRLVASDASEEAEFGIDVAMDGDTIVVGAHGNTDFPGTTAGAAYVFVRRGGTWVEEQKLLPSDSRLGDQFGQDVAVEQDTIAVSALFNDHGRPGAAYVFERLAGGWSEAQALAGSDARAGEGFGNSLALTDDTLIIGAPGHSHGPPGCGSAYVFVRRGGAWVEEQEIIAADAVPWDDFGRSVAAEGNLAVIGASQADRRGLTDVGAAYVFRRGGGTWTQEQSLVPSLAADSDHLGIDVAVESGVVAVGAEDADPRAIRNAGSVMLFASAAGRWDEQQSIAPSALAEGDRFGNSVAASQGCLIVGAPGDDRAARNAGAVYLLSCAWPDPQAECAAGSDVAQPCDGVQLAGSADGAGGVTTSVRWTSSCPGTTFAPSDDVLDPFVTFGASCGVSCELTLSVIDDAGQVLCSDALEVEIDDTTAPRIVADASDRHCVWSPRHWWACYERTDFHPVVTDDCGQPTWRFIGCVSDQPVDDVGDGHTDPDCLVSPDGERVCVRAERQGGEPAGRTYTVSIEALDDCGNASEAAIGTITVPHDRRNHPDCRATPRGGRRLPSR